MFQNLGIQIGTAAQIGLRRYTNFLRRQEGQGMAEYGIVIALVAVVAAVAIKLFGSALSDFFINKVNPLLS